MENSKIINTKTTDDKEFGKVKLVNLNELIKHPQKYPQKRPQKRKPYQKWTSEQKRSLIENRIKYEYLFRRSYHRRLPYSTAWRCVIKKANLEIFGQAFVRKQWQNFVSKYKSLAHYDDTKRSHLELGEKKIEYLTTRWEFFSLIHKWIITKHNDVEPHKDEEDYEDFICSKKSSNKSNSPLVDHEYGKKVENIYFSLTDEKMLSKLTKKPATVAPRICINPDIFKSSTSNNPIQAVNKVANEIQYAPNNNNTLNNDDHNYIPIPTNIYKSRPEQHANQEENFIKKTVTKGKTQKELYNNTESESVTKNLSSSSPSISENEVPLQQLTQINSSSVDGTNISNVSASNVVTEICQSFMKQESDIYYDADNNEVAAVENDIDPLSLPSSSSTLSASSPSISENEVPLQQLTQINSSSVDATNIPNVLASNVVTEICQFFMKQESDIYYDADNNEVAAVENDIDHLSSPSTLSTTVNNQQNHQPLSQQQKNQQPSSSLEKPFTSNTKNKKRKKSKNHHSHKKKKCSYEEKLYRHTKKTSYRIEKRLDALLNVFAQIVKSDYPNVNVDPLLKNRDDDSNDTMSTSNSDSE